MLVAGIDSSTQSCKVLIRDAHTGELVRSGTAKHPDGTEVHPDHWWTALLEAIENAGGLDGVVAMSVGGQQHGMVVLDSAGEVIREALLWNDTRSADAAVDLIAELGEVRGSGADDGARVWAEQIGTVPVASITATKLRWLADAEPENAARVAAVALPHDWLTWKLAGGPAAGLDALATDRSDASGTGYFSTPRGEYDREILDLALRRDTSDVVLPRVLAANGEAGVTVEQGAIPAGIKLGPGCGDNAGAALGLEMGVGDVSISIGTSGVVAAVIGTPAADPSGTLAGFASATDSFLPLAVTLNGSQTLDKMRELLNVDYAEFDRLALAGASGAGGMTLVPYYQGERTPNLPRATASLLGMTLAGATRENLARAAVEGLLSALADGMDAFVEQGLAVEKILLIGGGAASAAVQQIAPEIFGQNVWIPEPGEYVANGAARQAAWLALGELPTWDVSNARKVSAESHPEVREAYAARRNLYVEQ
ncbi:MAG: FGGY family carbohydrate kinase [Ancrocorticia sp.]